MISKNESNNLKGIAIILVMLGHLVATQQIHLPKEFRYFATFSVSIFLILSGYGLTKSYLADGLKNFIRKRISSVYIPFLITSIILFLLFHKNNHSTFELIKTITFLNKDLTLDGTMWFIYYILIWYTAFYITFKLKSNNIIKVTLLFFLSLGLNNYSYIIDSKTLSFQFSLHAFSFPIGVALALMPKIQVNRNAFSIMTTSMMILFIFLLSKLWGDYEFWLYSSSSVTFALSIIMIVKELNINSTSLLFIGAISYEAYLLEGVLRHVSFHQNLTLNTLIFFMITFIASFILQQSIGKIKQIIPK